MHIHLSVAPSFHAMNTFWETHAVGVGFENSNVSHDIIEYH